MILTLQLEKSGLLFVIDQLDLTFKLPQIKLLEIMFNYNMTFKHTISIVQLLNGLMELANI